MITTGLQKIPANRLQTSMKRGLKGKNIKSTAKQVVEKIETKLPNIGLAEGSAENINKKSFWGKDYFKKKFEELKTIVQLYKRQYKICKNLSAKVDIIKLCKNNNGEVPIKEIEVALDIIEMMNKTYVGTKDIRKEKIQQIIKNCKNSNNQLNLEALNLIKKIVPTMSTFYHIEDLTKLCQDEKGISTYALSFYNDVLAPIRDFTSLKIDFLADIQTENKTISKTCLKFAKELMKKGIVFKELSPIIEECWNRKKDELYPQIVKFTDELISGGVSQYHIANVVNLCSDNGKIIPKNRRIFDELRQNDKACGREFDMTKYVIDSETKKINSKIFKGRFQFKNPKNSQRHKLCR